MDEAVADIFGFHALQLGLPEIETLRANRMPQRWVVSHERQHGRVEGDLDPSGPLGWAPSVELGGIVGAIAAAKDGGGNGVRPGIHLHAAADQLPFPERSLDLVTLPHTLELVDNPHGTLSEVARVLRAEGRVVIAGLNPGSLWGMRQISGKLRRQVGLRRQPLFLPSTGEFIGLWRLRDWLRLLGLEIEYHRFGVYKPPVKTQRWLDRYEWLERQGGRLWPFFGAVYVVVAVKRVRGIRMVGLARRAPQRAQRATTVVSPRQGTPCLASGPMEAADASGRGCAAEPASKPAREQETSNIHD